MSDLLTVQELADYLRVTVKTVYRLLERGQVPSVRVGHLWRFDKASVDDWLHQSTKATASILIIDDDETVGILFKETLQETGHEITAVQDPNQGLELVKKQDYDIVFLDLRMPGTNGAELFKQIRAIKPELPVTIITGYPDSELMMNALAHGPFGVINKPFTSSDITSAINNYIRFGISGK